MSARSLPLSRLVWPVVVLVLVAPEAARRLEHAQSSSRLLDAGAIPGGPADPCGRPAAPTAPSRLPAYFADVTDQAGIEFQHVVGPLGTWYLPEINGSGAAMFDADGDGLLDLVLINGNRSPEAPGPLPADARLGHRLYLQRALGKFIDATASSGLGGEQDFGVGCATGDVDNDGDLDLYITCVGADRFYLNDGRGRFTELAEQAGLVNHNYGTCAAFFDYDRDGWLDLFVVNYVEDPAYGMSVGCGFGDGRVSYCGPLKFQPTIDRLFHNDGLVRGAEGTARVRFTEVTAAAGLNFGPTNGFGVTCGDFNGDHWPDLFVANDAGPNRLWINQRNGTFLDEGVARGAAYAADGRPQAGMGAVAGDVDNDGDLDLLATHLMNEYATLYRQAEGALFEDSSRQARLTAGTAAHTGWGAALVDLNHDGYLDLPIVNGAVVHCSLKFPPHGETQFQLARREVPDSAAWWREFAAPNLLYISDQVGRFMDQSARAGAFALGAGSARALVTGDVDNDGDIDLLVTYCGQKPRLYRNDLPKRGHWLSVRAVEPALHRDALGAQVVVVTAEARHVRVVSTGGGYLAAHDPRAHFGLGDFDRYLAIEVRWPDGTLERFKGGPADCFLTVAHGTGEAVDDVAGSSP